MKTNQNPKTQRELPLIIRDCSSIGQSRFSIIGAITLYATTFGQGAVMAATNRLGATLPPISATHPSTSRPLLMRLPPSIDSNVRYTVYNIDARTHATATNAIDPRTGPTRISLNTNATHILRPETTQPIKPGVLTKSRVLLPAKIGVATEISHDEVVLHTGDLFLQASESPMRWDTNRNCYATELAIGVDFEGDAAVSELPVALTFELMAEHASVKPREISIRKVGPPYQHVLLTAEDGRVEPVVTAHHPKIPAKPLKLQCLRELGDLVMLCDSTRILGYGLGTANATISRLAKDHLDFSDGSELKLAVKSSAGKLVSGAAATIPKNESTTEINLRSAGIGSAELIARYGPYITSQRVEFVFPIAFIIAALLGGCLGGLARSFRERITKANARYKLIAEGCIAGLIVVAAAAGGIVIFQVSPGVVGTELGAFLLAALAGYIGASIIDRITSGGKTKPSTSRP